MGVVYEAFDPVIKRALAIKTIRRELIQGGESGTAAVGRFRNEAQAAGRLMHPGIAAVYEYGEDEQCSFIAMEYVAGNSLREYISRGTRFPEEDVLSIMVQLLEALEHAHFQGVWHRDIKPANLIITRAGRLKVADFGVARIESMGLTLDGSVIGTPGYMAPEQYSGDSIDRRVDIYAAGVVMYQLIAGRLPFAGTAEAVMYKTLTEAPLPPSQHEGAERFERFDPMVLRALAKEPDARYASAEDFRRDLAEVGQHAVSAALSEETLIMDPARAEGRGPNFSTGAASLAGASGAGGSGTAAPSHDWDPSVLADVESRLSRHLGPIARVMVRRAAARCIDLATLTTMLADQIPQEAERTAFRTATLAGRAGAGGGTGGSPAKAAGATRMASATRIAGSGATGAREPTRLDTRVEDFPLTPAFIEHATRILAAEIGPIAKLLVRKATQSSAGRRAFAQCVVGLASDLKQPERVVEQILRGPG